MAVNGGGQGLKLVVVDVVFVGLAFVAVLLRLVARRLRKQAFQLNDWFILVALICQIAQSAVQDLNTARGALALSDTETTPDATALSNQINFPGSILWGLPLLFVRLSVLHYYCVLLPTKHFRHLCILLMAAVSVFYVAYTTVIVLSCLPVSMNWNSNIHGQCINVTQRVLIGAAVNTGVDLAVVALPLPLILLGRLAQTGPQKAFTALMFLLGLAVCATAGLRVLYLERTSFDAHINYNLATLLEPSLAILVACLPLFAGLALCCASGRRATSPDGRPTITVLRGTPSSDQSTLHDLEKGDGPSRQGSDADSILAAKQRVAELRAGLRSNETAEDKALARIFGNIGLSPKPTGRGADWPLSQDVERGLASGPLSRLAALSTRVSRSSWHQAGPHAAHHRQWPGSAAGRHGGRDARRVSKSGRASWRRERGLSISALQSRWGRETARSVHAVSWGAGLRSPRPMLPSSPKHQVPMP